MLRLVLNPVGGYFLVVLVAAGLVALLTLGPGKNRVSSGRRRILFALRTLVVLSAIFALLRPTLVWTTIARKPATLLLLADQSRSMQVTDSAGSKTRWDSLRACYEAAQPALADLTREIEVKTYLFDAEPHLLEMAESPTAWPRQPEGTQTAIGWVLEEVLRRESGKRLAGVIMLSDGAQRVLPAKDIPPQTPARRLADLGFHFHAVPFGQARTLDQTRDVAVSELRVPNVVFVKNRLDVSAVAEFEGFVGKEVPVQLLVETSPGKMEVVDSTRLHPDQNSARLSVDLNYVPMSPGEKKVTLKIAPQAGEIVTTNNETSTFVTVLDGGLKVLYLNGALQPDQKWVRWSLDASPDMNVDYHNIDARRPETRPKNILGWFDPGRYDVYILSDLDASAFSENELQALREAVEQGAGLIMTGGLHSFGAGGYATSPLADVLPVEMDRLERQNFGEPVRADAHLPEDAKPTMRPTRAGRSHSVMQLAPPADNDATWAALPPLLGANRLDRVARGATVLAETTDNHPLLIAREFGRGRVLAFGGDSTWRWWLSGHEAAHKRFWRQIVLWLARKEQASGNSVWLNLAERRFSPGTRVDFTIGARNEHGEPVADATYEVEITRPDGSRATPRLRRQGDEMAGTYLDASVPGDYGLTVTAKSGGAVLGTTQARFLVYDQDLELDNPAADRGALESLAAMTEGSTVAPEQLSELLGWIKKQLQELEVETLVKRSLWDTWTFFLLLVGLLCLEWWLRKRWGLV